MKHPIGKNQCWLYVNINRFLKSFIKLDILLRGIPHQVIIEFKDELLVIYFIQKR
jgi:hypothetical protein